MKLSEAKKLIVDHKTDIRYYVSWEWKRGGILESDLTPEIFRENEEPLKRLEARALAYKLQESLGTRAKNFGIYAVIKKRPGCGWEHYKTSWEPLITKEGNNGKI